MTVTCPRCGLEHDEGEWRCECGKDLVDVGSNDDDGGSAAPLVADGGTQFYVVDEATPAIVGGPHPTRTEAKRDDALDDPDTIIMSERALKVARSERPIRDERGDVDIVTDGGAPTGPDPSRAHHPQTVQDPNPQARVEAHLGPHQHLCELCGQEFADISELADHECRPVRTDGGRLPDSIEEFTERARQREELPCQACGDRVERRFLIERRCPGCRYGGERDA